MGKKAENIKPPEAIKKPKPPPPPPNVWTRWAGGSGFCSVKGKKIVDTGDGGKEYWEEYYNR